MSTEKELKKEKEPPSPNLAKFQDNRALWPKID
jgi:hypothetical protein